MHTLLCRLVPVGPLPAIPFRFTDRSLENLPSPLGNGFGLLKGTLLVGRTLHLA